MAGPAGQSFQTPDFLRMFPSFVWKARLKPEIRAPMNESLLRTLGKIGAPLADLKPGDSWQSDHGLHELGPFRELGAASQRRTAHQPGIQCHVPRTRRRWASRCGCRAGGHWCDRLRETGRRVPRPAAPVLLIAGRSLQWWRLGLPTEQMEALAEHPLDLANIKGRESAKRAAG
jgi:hypothetical protein